MSVSNATKRKSERIAFAVPVLGRVGPTNVAITDLSVYGAGVQHRIRLHASENRTNLIFWWREQEINLDCRIVRTRLERHVAAGTSLTIYHSGLRFVRPSDRETSIVRRIITSRIARALKEQKANAYAVSIEEVDSLTSDLTDPPPASLVYLNELVSVSASKRKGYIRCTLEGSLWKRQVVDSPDQPATGFTVGAEEGDDAIRMLCRTYEASSTEGRQLIRTFAHMSLTDPSTIPRDLFQP